MRAANPLLFALVSTLALSHVAASSPPHLETVWSTTNLELEAGTAFPKGRAVASDGAAVVVLEASGGVLGVNISDGAVLWKIPALVNYSVAVELRGAKNDILLVSYVVSPDLNPLNCTLGNGAVHVYNLSSLHHPPSSRSTTKSRTTTAAPHHNFPRPSLMWEVRLVTYNPNWVSSWSMIGEQHVVIACNMYNPTTTGQYLNLQKYEVSTERMAWNVTHLQEGATESGVVGKDTILVPGLPSVPGPSSGTAVVYSFDLTDGHFLCNFTIGLANEPLGAGNLFGGSSMPSEHVALFDATKRAEPHNPKNWTCRLVYDFGHMYYVSARAIGGSFYTKQPNRGSNGYQAEFAKINEHGVTEWALPIVRKNVVDMVFGVSGVDTLGAGSAGHDDVVLFNVDLKLQAVNVSNGVLLWNTSSLRIPFAPMEPGRAVVPLMDREMSGQIFYFVANLQGFTLLNSQGSVVDFNVHTPITPALGVMDPKTGRRLVLYGDLQSRQLLARRLVS